MTGSSTQEQTNPVGARLSDCKTNTAVVEIRLTRDEDIIHTHNQEYKCLLLVVDFPPIAWKNP